MSLCHNSDLDLDQTQACGGNGVHGRCRNQSKNFLKSSKVEEMEYTCRDCGGDGPTLLERERPRVISDAINASLNSSQLLETSSDTSIAETSMEIGERKEEKDSKSGFFASKEEMLSLLAGIVERSKREDAAMEVADDEEKMEELKIGEGHATKNEKAQAGAREKGHLWIRRDLSTLGAEALSGNICDSEDVQMGVMEPAPEVEDEEDGEEGEEGEAEEDDLLGENPIRSMPPVKRTFGNRLLKMLQDDPTMMRSKEKPESCYMSFFFKMINPVKPPQPHPLNQTNSCSEKTIPRPAELKTLPEKLIPLPKQPIDNYPPTAPLEPKIGEVLSAENQTKVGTPPAEENPSDFKQIEVENMEVEEKIACVESESVSKNTVGEDKETDEQTLATVEPKKYRRGPKSRKRLLEIKNDDESPKKVKVTDRLLEAFQEDLTVDEFKKVKEVKNGEANLAFKLFKLWFKQLDTETNKCGECGNVSSSHFTFYKVCSFTMEAILLSFI